MTNDAKQRIESLIAKHPVILFMKGNKVHPQCGFSKSVVEIIRGLVSDFETFDVLSDPQMREGIKTFSSWPTIPQLYINGEFVGGCDIVMDLFQKNELQSLLGIEKASFAPCIKISDTALSALKSAAKEQGEDPTIRVSISADFEHGMSFDEKRDDDFLMNYGDVKLVIDPYSALRADELELDYVEDKLDSGFSFDNPNEPPEVSDLSVQELDEWRKSNKEHLLIDVRPRFEWEMANISDAKILDEMSQTELDAIDKNLPIVLHCHHGGRSRRSAESFRARGFKNLYNLTGGIEAWSQKIDSSVPIYTK